MRGAALVRGAAGLALAGCGGAPPADPGPKVSPVPLTRAAVAEADDEVELQTGKGHVEPAAVEAAIFPYRSELSSCYTQRVGKRRWLAGKLALRWEIAADGTIGRVLLADSDVGAWPIEKCVLDTARHTSFGRPVGGAAEVSLPLAFSLGAGGQATQWDDDRAAKAIGAPQIAKLDACGKAKASARAGAKAAVVVAVAVPDDVRITLYVGARGRALSVGFASAATEIDEAWAACAEKAALAWRLPDPRGQIAKLAVRYRAP
jgi:hypothetical protein